MAGGKKKDLDQVHNSDDLLFYDWGNELPSLSEAFDTAHDYLINLQALLFRGPGLRADDNDHLPEIPANKMMYALGAWVNGPEFLQEINPEFLNDPLLEKIQQFEHGDSEITPKDLVSHMVEMAKQYPSKYLEELDKEIVTTAQKVLESLGIEDPDGSSAEALTSYISRSTRFQKDLLSAQIRSISGNESYSINGAQIVYDTPDM